MNRDDLWRDLASLPPAAQEEVADFIAFLRTRNKPARVRRKPLRPWTEEPFIGMWQDRTDMEDSTAWVRRLREGEWSGLDE